MKNKKLVVIVTGFGRSGTSCMAEILHVNGIKMGNVMRGGNKENPHGYFENLEIRKINDRVLNPWRIKDWDYKKKFKLNNEFLDQGIKAISDYNCDFLGFKDPRTCLTLPFWYKVLSKLKLTRHVKVIHMVRNPASCANSLKTITGMDLNTGIECWYLFNKTVRADVKDHVLYVEYERLLSDPNQLNRISEFLKHPLKQITIDRSLERSNLSYKYTKKIQGEYNKLKRLANE